MEETMKSLRRMALMMFLRSLAQLPYLPTSSIYDAKHFIGAQGIGAIAVYKVYSGTPVTGMESFHPFAEHATMKLMTNVKSLHECIIVRPRTLKRGGCRAMLLERLQVGMSSTPRNRGVYLERQIQHCSSPGFKSFSKFEGREWRL